MKKLRVLFLVFVFATLYAGTASSEVNPKSEFQSIQSYELSELITLFSRYKTSNSSVVSTELYRDTPLSNLYNLDKNKLGQPLIEVNNFFGGKIGILFNGKGYVKQEQIWSNGLLKNTYVDMGYNADAVFLCPLYWGFNSLQLTLNVSPYYIKKHFGKSGIKNVLDINNYFTDKNFSVDFLTSVGIMPYGKSFWKLTTPENKSVYLVVRQTCGASGRVGTTWFIMFYDKQDASDCYNSLKPQE